MKGLVKGYGKGEKVVFIAGAGGNTRAWYFQRNDLQNFMEVILMELPGHGQDREGQGLDSIEGYRDYVHTALQGLGIDSCHMVGHSMGGAIAMSFALTYSQMLKGLVLITTAAKLKISPDILKGLEVDKEKAVRMIIEYGFSKGAPQQLKEECFKDMMECRTEVIYNDFMACERFDIMDRVKEIRTPTLIICGKEDILTPPAYSEYLHSNIQGSRLIAIEGAGHMVILEKPDEVNRAIKDFVLNRG